MISAMKKLTSLLLALALLLCCCAAGAEGTPAGAEKPDLSALTAVEMTRLMGNGINLGNTMEACNNGASGGYTSDNPTHYETMWGQPVTTADMMKAMKEAGFDTIRIPVAWMTNATHLNQGDWTIAGPYMDRVEEIVNYALDAGMFVIVNDHWDGGWWGMFGSESEETRALAMEAYIGMWQQIAGRFAGYDERLIFESANEELGARFDENSPLFCQDSIKSYLPDSERYALTNRINQTFVDTVRACGGYNGHRFLLIAGYGTNIDQTFDSRFRMPEDSAEKKLMVSVHYYDPWSYCGASSAKAASLWGKKTDYRDMYATLSKMSKFTGAGYGVVIGEYGALPGSDNEMKKNSPAYHKAFLDCCDALDLTGCLWDCSGLFARLQLKFRNEEMAEVYAGRNAASEAGRDYAEIAAAGKASFDAAAAAAPDTLSENANKFSADSSVAWIMFSGGDWGTTYSVGDTYDPDSITPGLVPTDAEITGPGTYTVALDFTETDKGYAANTAFCALGISAGEDRFPGYCIMITELKVNGESVKMKGRNYTCSDDGHCTRTNLFNEWITDMKNERGRARVLVGDLTGISATLLDREAEYMQQIRTMEITFRYEPRK